MSLLIESPPQSSECFGCYTEARRFAAPVIVSFSHAVRSSRAAVAGASRTAEKKKAPPARGQVVSWEKTSNRGHDGCSPYREPSGCGNATRAAQMHRQGYRSSWAGEKKTCVALASPLGAKKKAPLARGQVVSWEKTSNRGRNECSSNHNACGCRKVTRLCKRAPPTPAVGALVSSKRIRRFRLRILNTSIGASGQISI
jgi:hypothetical protein